MVRRWAEAIVGVGSVGALWKRMAGRWRRLRSLFGLCFTLALGLTLLTQSCTPAMDRLGLEQPGLAPSATSSGVTDAASPDAVATSVGTDVSTDETVTGASQAAPAQTDSPEQTTASGQTAASGQTFTERMATEHQGDRPVATGIATLKPAQAIVSASVNYATVDGKPITGFLSQPQNATEPLPAIIAIHEWWGLNDNVRAVTERLAGEGYTALAVDLYGGRVAQDPNQAKTLMQSVMGDPQPAEENLRQAYDYLLRELNAPKVGSIGWCFGGAWSLKTGLLLPNELDAVAIYYGRLVTDQEQLATLSMPIAGFFGAKDQGIPVADVKAFETALKALDKPAEIYIYEDADHAFANPSGKRYNAEAAADAWEKTKIFFETFLQDEEAT